MNTPQNTTATIIVGKLKIAICNFEKLPGVCVCVCVRLMGILGLERGTGRDEARNLNEQGVRAKQGFNKHQTVAVWDKLIYSPNFPRPYNRNRIYGSCIRVLL